MKAVIFIFLFFSFLGGAEEWVERCTHSKTGFTYHLFALLDLDDFPIEVCIDRGFSQEKINDIYTAFALWNDAYLNYVFDNVNLLVKKGALTRMGNKKVEFTKIPVRLFTQCDKNKDPYILIKHKSLNKLGNTDYLGSTKPIDNGVLFKNLDYILITITTDRPLITSDTNRQMRKHTKDYFLDIVLHELGHAIGIPHIKNDSLMKWEYERCDSFSGICYPTDRSIRVFLNPYLAGIVE